MSKSGWTDFEFRVEFSRNPVVCAQRSHEGRGRGEEGGGVVG